MSVHEHHIHMPSRNNALRALGFIVMGLALILVYQEWHFRQVDKELRENDHAFVLCVAQNFQDLATTLNERAISAELDRRADNITREATGALLALALQEDAPPAGSPEAMVAIAAYKKALRESAQLSELADQQRSENPVPDYPNGVCAGLPGAVLTSLPGSP